MKRILSCSFVAFLFACKTIHSVPMQTAKVKPSALIGTAYDAMTQEFTGVSCLDLSRVTAQDYEMQPLRSFSSEVLTGPGSAELEAVFGAFQKSFYTAATGLRLSRPYETVQRILEGEREVVKVLLVQSDHGGLRFKAESLPKLQLSQEAQTMVQQILTAQGAARKQILDTFLKTCGTGFLAGTRYKLGMAGTLRWTFPTMDAKKRWRSELQSRDAADLPEPLPTVPLRYESFMKETRDISMKALGETGSKDCAPEAPGPCLDAWRLFQNATLPGWQGRLEKIFNDFDAVMPQAFLFAPEVVSYHEIEPALAGITLEPAPAQAAAWRKARERFVDLYAAVSRKQQEKERAEGFTEAQAYQRLLEDIAVHVAPCYRPALDLGMCERNAERLEGDFLKLP